MDLKKIEKLENLLDALVDEIRSLRAENQRLNEENARVESELAATAGNDKKYRDKIEKLAVLERAHSKLESGNAAARLKVQSILRELEKTDWS